MSGAIGTEANLPDFGVEQHALVGAAREPATNSILPKSTSAPVQSDQLAAAQALERSRTREDSPRPARTVAALDQRLNLLWREELDVACVRSCVVSRR